MLVKISSGIHIWCDIDGAGLVVDEEANCMRPRPTLLLMHGGPGGDHTSFKPAFSAITDCCQVIYYDHRGQGRSDRSTSDTWNLDRWADDAVELCEALGVEKPFVVGLSFGGFVAQRLATRHPEFAAGVVLNSTASALQTPSWYKAMGDVFEKLGGSEARNTAEAFWGAKSEEEMARAMGRYLKICGPLYTQTPGNALVSGRTISNQDVLTHFNQHEGADLNLLPELRSIRVPVLAISGELDPVMPASEAQLMVNAIPEDMVRFERFPRSGHGVFRDEPGAYFSLLRSFVCQHFVPPPQPEAKSFGSSKL